MATVTVPALAAAATAQPVNAWAVGYGGTSIMWNWGNVALTPAGNTVFAGQMYGGSPNSNTFGSLSWGPTASGCADAYFAQAGGGTGTAQWMTGTSTWSVSGSPPGCVEPYAVHPGPDSSILVSALSGTGEIVGNPSIATLEQSFAGKIAPDGTWAWASTYQVSNPIADQGFGIIGLSPVPGGSGASIIVGRTDDDAQVFGPTTFTNLRYPHIVRVNADGSFGAGLAADNVTGTGANDGRTGGWGVIARADGSAVAAGSFAASGSITFGTTTLAGSGDGDADYWFAKGTPGGAWEWATKVRAHGVHNGWAWPTAKEMGTDAAGNIYVIIPFDGTATFVNASGTSPVVTTPLAKDTAVAKMDKDGVWQWAVRLGTPGISGSGNRGGGLSTLADGTSVIVSDFSGTLTLGETTLTADGGSDVLLAAIGPDGTWLWARKDGGANDQRGLAVSATSDGRVAIQGDMTAPATFGSQTLSSGIAYVANYWMAPQAPTNVKAVGGDRSATISWDSLGSGVTSYTVTAAPGGASCTVRAPATTCTITGLTPGVKYTFSVTGTGPGGTGPAGSADAVPTSTTPAEQKAAEADPLIALPAAVVLRGATLLATVRPSVAGTVRVTVTLRGRGVGTVTTTATTAGRMRVAVPLSRWARAQIRRGPVTLRVTTRLTDGAGKTATASRTVKAGRVTPVVPVTG